MNGQRKLSISTVTEAQEYPPEITKTKEEIRLKNTKRKVKIAALKWDSFVLQ